MAQSQPPKRHEPRFGAFLPAVVHAETGDEECQAESLSHDGVLLSGTMVWPHGSVLEATLRSPAGDVSVHVRGRIAHVFEDSDTGHLRVGMEFEPLTAEQRRGVDSLVSRVVEGREPAPLAALPPGAPLKDVLAALQQIPLAHRVALAQRALPRERSFLLADPRPQVLEALARNPNLTQTEVRGLARMHQLLPSTVELIAEDRRWADDDELKLLLATHPRATFPVAEKIVAGLSERLQRKVLQTPGLNPGLRTRLSQKFGNRRGTSW